MVVLHRTNQGGSVVNFVIISVILVLAVASVGYVVIKRGEQARKDIAIAAIDEQTKNSQDKSSTGTTKPESEGDKSTNGESRGPTEQLSMSQNHQLLYQLLAQGKPLVG